MGAITHCLFCHGFQFVFFCVWRTASWQIVSTISPLDQPRRQQSQRPAGAARPFSCPHLSRVPPPRPLRRCSATQRDELRLAFAVEFAQGFAPGVFALEGLLQPVLDADAPRPLHGGNARLRGPRDPRIAPAALDALGVGQPQDARMALVMGTGFAFAREGFKSPALFGTPSDVMLFRWHHAHL